MSRAFLMLSFLLSMVWVHVDLCNFTISPTHTKKGRCVADRKGLWDTLRVYGVGEQLLEGVRSFYENASASVRVNGEISESFSVEVGVRHGCMMSPWLFNIYMDVCIREMKVGVWDLGARLKVRCGAAFGGGLVCGWHSSVGRE